MQTHTLREEQKVMEATMVIMKGQDKKQREGDNILLCWTLMKNVFKAYVELEFCPTLL